MAKAREGNGLPALDLWRQYQIDADPDNDAVTLTLQQDASEFRAPHKNIVGPLQNGAGQQSADIMKRTNDRDARNQGKSRCWWIPGTEPRNGRPHEVAETVVPNPSGATSSRRLPIRNQPVPFKRQIAPTNPCEKLGVGRSDL